MSKPPRLGPMNLRLPLFAPDRQGISRPPSLHESPHHAVQNQPVVEGARATWPSDSLSIRGFWQAGGRPLQVRPIFPGSIRFLADDLTTVPSADQIDVQDGKVTPAGLAQLSAISGTLLI